MWLFLEQEISRGSYPILASGAEEPGEISSYCITIIRHTTHTHSQHSVKSISIWWNNHTKTFCMIQHLTQFLYLNMMLHLLLCASVLDANLLIRLVFSTQFLHIYTHTQYQLSFMFAVHQFLGAVRFWSCSRCNIVLSMHNNHTIRVRIEKFRNTFWLFTW